MGLAESLQLGLQSIVQTWATSKSAALSAALAPLALTGVTIYIFIIGWAVMRGEVHNSLSTIVWKIFRIVVIASIALGGGVYQSMVIEGVNGIEGAFVQLFGGTDTIGQLIDTQLTTLDGVVIDLFNRASESLIPNIPLLIAAILCLLAQIIITLACLLPLLVAKITLAILLAVGPAFVMLAIWPATQRFTESWLATTLASVMTVVIVAAVIGIAPTVLGSYTAAFATGLAGDATNAVQGAITLIIVTVVLAYLAWKSMEIGSALVSGASFGHPAGAMAYLLMNTLTRGRSRPASGTKGNAPQEAAPSPRTTTPNNASLAHRNVLSNMNRQPYQPRPPR